jgi:NAD(P)-dependent dehydrogenase (short-subunit alcohol dehydrogenase family)
MGKPSVVQTLVKLARFYARFTPSFTQVGYIARGLPWRPVRADFTGQVWLVTGATGGLGEAAALEAAARGATVYAAGRNRLALDILAAAAGDGRGSVTSMVCDLANMAAVEALARQVVARAGPVDVLVNNVGVLRREFASTPEGLEASYATNLLGHYVLTEALQASGGLASGAAIINVVSGGLYNAPLNTALLDQSEAGFNGFTAYASHKRAQLALADHWRAAFKSIRAQTYAVHPGWADTAGVKTSLPKFRKVLAPILRTPRQGVDTIVWLVAQRPAEAVDQVWFDRKPRSAHAYPFTRVPLASAAEVVAHLRADSDRLLGPATNAPLAAAVIGA